MTPTRASWFPLPANAALVSAPPNSIVTSLGMGMQADSRSISTNTAT